MIETRFGSFLAPTNEVVRNTDSSVKSTFFKSDEEKYNTFLHFAYNQGNTVNTPDKDYLFTKIYSNEGFLIGEKNKTLGYYYHAYDPNTGLPSLKIFNLKEVPTDFHPDMYSLYLYEFDENRN